jgi:hypothetical protein
VIVERVCSISSSLSFNLWISLSRVERVWVKSSNRRLTPRWPIRRFDIASGPVTAVELGGISAVVGDKVEVVAAIDSDAGVEFESFSGLVGGRAGNDLSGDDIRSVGITISLGSDGGTTLGSKDLTRSL